MSDKTVKDLKQEAKTKGIEGYSKMNREQLCAALKYKNCGKKASPKRQSPKRKISPKKQTPKKQSPKRMSPKKITPEKMNLKKNPVKKTKPKMEIAKEYTLAELRDLYYRSEQNVLSKTKRRFTLKQMSKMTREEVVALLGDNLKPKEDKTPVHHLNANPFYSKDYMPPLGTRVVWNDAPLGGRATYHFGTVFDYTKSGFHVIEVNVVKSNERGNGHDGEYDITPRWDSEMLVWGRKVVHLARYNKNKFWYINDGTISLFDAGTQYKDVYLEY